MVKTVLSRLDCLWLSIPELSEKQQKHLMMGSPNGFSFCWASQTEVGHGFNRHAGTHSHRHTHTDRRVAHNRVRMRHAAAGQMFWHTIPQCSFNKISVRCFGVLAGTLSRHTFRQTIILRCRCNIVPLARDSHDRAALVFFGIPQSWNPITIIIGIP